MDSFIDKNLAIIANCLSTQTYRAVETDRFELKDLSVGWGDDWYKTVCAFLNTNGGVIVIGINEKDSAKPPHYRLTGYTNSQSNENHLKNELPKKFTDREGKPLDVSAAIRLEIRNFMDSEIAIVYVEDLNAENKYAFYNGVPYIRKLTGDHKIDPKDIEIYEEVKRDIIQHRELSIVKNTGIENINLDTLNNFIFEYNRGKRRGDSIKKTKKEAKTFLYNQGFMLDEQLTILGMLVCGNELQRFIQGKCEADCYVVLPKTLHQVAQSKEVIEDNIIELIKRTQNYVWRNIQVGIGYTNGGIALPEYPESLIRESINNAFAHRDYSNERFVIVEIRPQESLMIRNPGTFERRQRINTDTEYGKIRRIIPLQVSRNPKLAHLLKSFDYWEGKGKGLSSLIDACLDNEIDVPYYILSQDEIRIYIPKGKVYDDEIEFWLESYAGYIQQKAGRALSSEEKILLAFFKKSEILNAQERYTILITPDNNHSSAIAKLEAIKLIFKNIDSPELYPIYQVDRVMMKNDFSNELLSLFGTEWVALKDDYKEVLLAIYHYNEFAAPTEIVSANGIGTYLYLIKYRKTSDISHFENFKRRIRNIFNQLENKNFIVRKDGKTKEAGGKPNFEINKLFKK
jgi:ATP-dependent DNA helicase RecG